MKVILLQDVPNVGRKYEIKKVKPGYGQNFLIKRGLARVATKENESRLATEKEKHIVEIKLKEELLKKSIEGLETVVIKLTRKANEKGHLFAGIGKDELVEALKKQEDLEFDEDNIIQEHPFKEVGKYSFSVKVGDKEAKLKVVVEAEK